MSLFTEEPQPLSLDFWNQEAFKQLQQQHLSGSLHHALLLLAPQGAGREEFAEELSRWVLCQSESKAVGDSYCGVCKSCTLLESEHHPDFHKLDIEEGKTQISVVQVRQLIDSMQETAHQGGWKVTNISDVMALNQSSFNALLKTLEEPRPNTLLILQTPKLQGVPATIRSRSQLLKLSIEDQSAVEGWLTERNGYSTEDLKLAQQLFPQAPYKAEDFAKNGDAFKCSEFVFDIAFILDGSASPLEIAKKWQSDVADCILWWQLFNRDLMLYQQTQSDELIQFKGQLEALQIMKKSLNYQGLSLLSEKIIELQRLISIKSPVNLMASWQSLLIYTGQLASKYKP